MLKENDKAISVYSRQGFIVSRKFNCFRVNTDEWKLQKTNNNEVKMREIDFSFQSQMETLLDFNLSWQNNFQALIKKPSDFKLIGAFHQENLVGYAIIEPETGDIPQLAVNKNYKRKRIGTMLLNEVKKINRAKIIKVVNIESNQNAIRSFIASNGIPQISSQFEMIKSI